MTFPEEYYIHVQGEQKGPYSFPQLKAMYDKNLIPPDTLYWREGMEDLELVADLCGKKRKDWLRHFKKIRLGGAAVIAGVVLLAAYFEPVLKDAWREMNDRDQTEEGAYWKARGFVREHLKNDDASAVFEAFDAATVTLTGTEATVILPGTLIANNGAPQKLRWKVEMEFDESRREWELPAGRR